MKLKELKTTNFKKGERYDFIIPLGATEQHGPFIPLGTDTYLIDNIVEKASKEFPEIIILPTLELLDEQDDKYIEKNLLNGPIDGHAGNLEISNMLAINPSLVLRPPANYTKNIVECPFKTDNISEACPDGIADNHPSWVNDRAIGEEALDIYSARMVLNLKKYF